MYPVIDKEKTGRRIRTLMEERNISVKDVQERLSLESVQSVYYWLNGRNIPTIDNLYALSELLQVPIDAMLYGNRKVWFDNFESGNIARLFIYYGEICKIFATRLAAFAILKNSSSLTAKKEAADV